MVYVVTMNEPHPPAAETKNAEGLGRASIPRPESTDLERPVDFPWPQKGDQLVSATGGRVLNAWFSGRADLVAHVEGYRRAADLVWRQIESEPRIAGIDFLVFPMVFLYRHYVELCLKDIIASGIYLETGTGSYPATHNLGELWKEARGHLERIGPGCSDEALASMTEMITQLDQLDPGSFTFRYPITKALTPTLPQNGGLNLALFHEGMEKMTGFFEGCQGMLSDYKSSIDAGW